jgi:hypothetical protein
MAVLFPFYCISDGQRVENVVYVGSDCERGTRKIEKKLCISGILFQFILCKTKLQFQYSIALSIN